jgi:uncharacterized protein YeaO (DUF488 family)
MKITIKRVYEPAEKKDGTRILIDRLWPRGLSKKKARVDLWLKDIAPTTILRKWFGHDPKKWLEFKKRYLRELRKNKQSLLDLKATLKKGKATLVYGAKDTKHNNAIVLKTFIDKL